MQKLSTILDKKSSACRNIIFLFFCVFTTKFIFEIVKFS